jgi:predicted porin
MKQHGVAALALALISTAAAQAQSQPTSNVTVYGVLDAYVEAVRGSETLWRLQSGGLSGSRLGFRGSEDLGSGLRALFLIESGINLDTGTNGQNAFWGRQAFVGLASAYGAVTLGRQYGSLYAVSTDFSVFSNNPVGASTGVIGGFGGYEPVRGGAATATGNGGPGRINNAVKLESASFSGFKVGGVWGMGEQSGTTHTRTADLYARYSAGPLDAMVSLVSDRVSGGLDVRTLSGAAAYTFGAARAMAGIISVDDRTDADVDGRGWWLGGDYRLGAHLLRAQYVLSEERNDDGETTAFGIGYQYDLSKRTSLYAAVTRFRNEGEGYVNRWTSAVPAGLLSGTERNITQAAAGVRHTF